MYQQGLLLRIIIDVTCRLATQQSGHLNSSVLFVKQFNGSLGPSCRQRLQTGLHCSYCCTVLSVLSGGLLSLWSIAQCVVLCHDVLCFVKLINVRQQIRQVATCSQICWFHVNNMYDRALPPEGDHGTLA